MITDEQFQLIQAYADGLERTADSIEVVARGSLESRKIISENFDVPEIEAVIRAADRMTKTSVKLMHEMRAVSAIAQSFAELER